MSVKLAIYRAVHNYPGGTEALAAAMKLSPHTLRHMADPKKMTHEWSFRRWDELIAIAGTGPLAAHCLEHGGVFVPTGNYADRPHGALLKQMHVLAREFGDVPRAIDEALEGDGKVSANELKRIECQIAEMVEAGAALLSLVRQIHERRAQLVEGAEA